MPQEKADLQFTAGAGGDEEGGEGGDGGEEEGSCTSETESLIGKRRDVTVIGSQGIHSWVPLALSVGCFILHNVALLNCCHEHVPSIAACHGIEAAPVFSHRMALACCLRQLAELLSRNLS